MSLPVNNGNVSEGDTISFVFDDGDLGCTHNINITDYLPNGFTKSNTVMISGNVSYRGSWSQCSLTSQEITMFRNGTIGISYAKGTYSSLFEATILLMRKDY